MQQIVNADKKLFLKLAELTRSGIQMTSKGRPVDLVFEQAMNHPDVLHMLQPMPVCKGTSSQPSQPSGTAPNRPGPYTRPPKGKGKNKSQGSLTIKMPQGLEHGVPGTKNGNTICFDYNLNKCTLPLTRGRCRKGLHICCFKGCNKSDHTYQNCPMRKNS